MNDRVALLGATLSLLVGCGPATSSADEFFAQSVRPVATTPAVLTVSPQPLDFTVPSAKGSFTVTDPGYGGALKAKPAKSCKPVARLVSAKAMGPNGTFDVVSIAAGRCDVTIRDANGNVVTETIHVTTTGGVIN